MPWVLVDTWVGGMTVGVVISGKGGSCGVSLRLFLRGGGVILGTVFQEKSTVGSWVAVHASQRLMRTRMMSDCIVFLFHKEIFLHFQE